MHYNVKHIFLIWFIASVNPTLASDKSDRLAQGRLEICGKYADANLAQYSQFDSEFRRASLEDQVAAGAAMIGGTQTGEIAGKKVIQERARLSLESYAATYALVWGKLKQVLDKAHRDPSLAKRFRDELAKEKKNWDGKLTPAHRRVK